MSRIRVGVIHRSDCKNLVMRYVDPVTGRWSTATKYRDPQTGIETETGTDRREAKKLAARWESDLNSGRDQGSGATTWQQFRLRYEDEVVDGLAVRTARKISTVFNLVEKALPRIANGKLSDLNTETISRFQAILRGGGGKRRAEDSVKSYLGQLQAALGWAARQKIIFAVPTIDKPPRAKKGGKDRKAKGRAITTEEFERMLGAVPAALVEWRKLKREAARKTSRRKGKAEHKTQTDSIPVEVDPAAVESWRHYLRGLWLSGLRLEESLELYWDRRDRLFIDLTGKRPMMVIPRELEKGGRDRRLPITPDFADFLLTTAEAERRGPVFKPLMPSGNRANADQAGRMLSVIGRLARVVVHTDAKTGDVKFASAHDLRRSFGNRWAPRVKAPTLMRMMRHESIQTTNAYYVDLDADEIAEDLYRVSGQGSTVSGTGSPSTGEFEAQGSDVTPYR